MLNIWLKTPSSFLNRAIAGVTCPKPKPIKINSFKSEQGTKEEGPESQVESCEGHKAEGRGIPSSS